MNCWSEGKAALAAIAVSGSVLASTFAFAGMMRGLHPRHDVGAGTALSTVKGEMTNDAAQGRHLFLMNCAHCHGDDASGDEGPDLHNLHKSDARIHELITAGIKGEMPSFGKKLGDQDIRALTTYLKTLKT